MTPDNTARAVGRRAADNNRRRRRLIFGEGMGEGFLQTDAEADENTEEADSESTPQVAADIASTGGQRKQ